MSRIVIHFITWLQACFAQRGLAPSRPPGREVPVPLAHQSSIVDPQSSIDLPWLTRIDNRWKTLDAPWPPDKDYRMAHSPTVGLLLLIREGAREPEQLYRERFVNRVWHYARRAPSRN